MSSVEDVVDAESRRVRIVLDKQETVATIENNLPQNNIAPINDHLRAIYPLKQIEVLFENNNFALAEHHVKWTIIGGASKIAFNENLKTCNPAVFGTIVDRIASIFNLVNRADTHTIGEGSAIVDLGDWSADVGLCFSDNRWDAFLIPDSSFLGSDGYAEVRYIYKDATSSIEAQPIAFWRGSSTGDADNGLLNTRRAQLCKLSKQYPDHLDAGISSIVQFRDEEEAESLRASGLCKPSADLRAHLHFRYQIDIDGNTNSWPGLFQKLMTGYPVLKVESEKGYRQWYYDRLVPWFNFVPIAKDLSDLINTIVFLNENPDLAAAIGVEGRRLAESLTIENECEQATKTIKAAFAKYKFRV